MTKQYRSPQAIQDWYKANQGKLFIIDSTTTLVTITGIARDDSGQQVIARAVIDHHNEIHWTTGFLIDQLIPLPEANQPVSYVYRNTDAAIDALSVENDAAAKGDWEMYDYSYNDRIYKQGDYSYTSMLFKTLDQFLLIQSPIAIIRNGILRRQKLHQAANRVAKFTPDELNIYAISLLIYGMTMSNIKTLMTQIKRGELINAK